jgi:hypothetical protein
LQKVMAVVQALTVVMAFVMLERPVQAVLIVGIQEVVRNVAGVVPMMIVVTVLVSMAVSLAV